MAHYEPGEEFEVEYGKSRKAKVKALGIRQKRVAFQKFQALKNAGADMDAAYEAIENLMQMMVVDCDDAFLDSIDETLAMEIASKVFQAAGLSADEAKKSESQPL